MRFIILTGNNTTLLDRAEGQLYHLAGVNAVPGDKESKPISGATEAATLAELLNMMNEQLSRLLDYKEETSGVDFSTGKVHTAGSGEERF
jgi:hypothetical protein